MFVEHCHKNNNNIGVLFTVCIADFHEVKIVDTFHSEIRISNVCNSNSNFKTDVRKFKLCLTSLIGMLYCEDDVGDEVM